jgi:sortase (surface protein transpeptidase)
MGEHRVPSGRTLDRLRRGNLLTPDDPRQQIAAGYILALLIVLTLVALVTVGRDVTNGTALPPTPPSPSPTLSIGRSTTSPPAPANTPTRKARKPSPKTATCRARGRSTFGGTAPAEICVPAIGIDASVMQLGLNTDRTVQVPPLSEVGDAGWYKYSAPPGTKGPAVILGHIDSAQYGEGVFFDLGKLGAGDQVMITRGDGMVATYSIAHVREVPKTAFPTMSVYGPTAGATIRLVTCGGQFDSSTGNYLDNIIAYGTLKSLRKG